MVWLASSGSLPMGCTIHIQGGLFSSANTLTGMPRVCLLSDGDSKSRHPHTGSNSQGGGLTEAHQALNRVGGANAPGSATADCE